jgi:hypothetical protein
VWVEITVSLVAGLMITPEARDLVRRSRNHLKDLSTLKCEERGRGSPTPGCGTVCVLGPSVSEWYRDDGESAVLEELARLSYTRHRDILVP